MTIFEDYVYWSERYTSKVMRTNKFHGSNITTIMSNVFQPMGIVMDHPIKQPTGNFVCDVKTVLVVGVLYKGKVRTVL